MTTSSHEIAHDDDSDTSASEVMENLQSRVRERASQAQQWALAFIDRNPLLAVGAATSAGFLMARMLRR